jgi:restriction endonuclease S subunit
MQKNLNCNLGCYIICVMEKDSNKIIKLKTVRSIDAGYSFRGKIKESPNSKVQVIQMKDVSVAEGINWSSCIKTEIPGKKKPVWLQSDDILFSARGTSNYAYHVDKNVEKTQTVTTPHFFVMKWKSDEVLSEYLVWYLNQTPCQRYFQSAAEGSATKSIRRSVLEDCPIVVPTIQEQQRIVNLQKTIEKENQTFNQLIENNNQLMACIAKSLPTRNKS